MAAAGADDLISARCQSKCLYELEQRHKNNTEARHMLRHQISTLCKEDILCASCIAPCRDLITLAPGGMSGEAAVGDGAIHNCVQSTCQTDSAIVGHEAAARECRQSCAFLAQISAQKPGQCQQQNQRKLMDSECSAFCDTDIDCPEIEKCCPIGCSRTCLSPSLNDTQLLPRPDGIIVQERKRKRSAILRWVMKRMTPQHTATNSNLFVIQWRWSVHKQPETMSPWQTVMVRNKMYAILKHLLVPGRFYLFRVAAVNQHGTYGFSQPSHPAFKLSKEVKAPSPPANFTILSMSNDDDFGSGGMATIGWAPPESELPIKEYRLAWWTSSPELAQAFALRQTRSNNKMDAPLDEDYENDDDTIVQQKRTQTLPGYTTKAELIGLDRGKVYLVELYATADSNQGELRGDPAILFVQYDGEKGKQKMMTTTMTTTRRTTTKAQNGGKSKDGVKMAEIGENSIKGGEDGQKADDEFADDPVGAPSMVAELKTPFFEGGRLKTIISWLDHPACNIGLHKESHPSFGVLIRSLRCLNQLPPQQFTVRGCVATLENLQFRCEYYVRVERAAADNGEKQQKQLVARLTFATLPCAQTPSDVPLQCDQGLAEETDEREIGRGDGAIGQALAQPLFGTAESSANKGNNGREMMVDKDDTKRRMTTPKTTTTSTTMMMTSSKKTMATTKKSSDSTTPEPAAKKRKMASKNGGERRRDSGGEEEDEEENGEEKEEWLPIEEVEGQQEQGGTNNADKPKERGTRTKTSGAISTATKGERPSQLSCFATSGSTAECLWNWPQTTYGGRTERNPLIGFRTMLSSTLAGVPPNVTIVGAEQRRVHLTGLKPSAVYRFRIQAITVLGLGTELDEHFSTTSYASSPSSSSSFSKPGNDHQNFPEISPNMSPWDFTSSSSAAPIQRIGAPHHFHYHRRPTIIIIVVFYSLPAVIISPPLPFSFQILIISQSIIPFFVHYFLSCTIFCV